MKWGYKTVHFELKKEGLLGSGFLDESEIEQELNEFGQNGWELVSVLEVQDGVIAFFKQPLTLSGMKQEYRAYEDVTSEQEGEPKDETFEEEDYQQVSEEEEETGEEDTPESDNTIGAIRIE